MSQDWKNDAVKNAAIIVGAATVADVISDAGKADARRRRAIYRANNSGGLSGMISGAFAAYPLGTLLVLFLVVMIPLSFAVGGVRAAIWQVNSWRGYEMLPWKADRYLANHLDYVEEIDGETMRVTISNPTPYAIGGAAVGCDLFYDDAYPHYNVVHTGPIPARSTKTFSKTIEDYGRGGLSSRNCRLIYVDPAKKDWWTPIE